MTAPLRFLAGVVGLWCLGRAGVLFWPVDDVARLAAAPDSTISRPIAPGLARSATSVPAYPGESRGPGYRLAANVAITAYAVALDPGLRRDASERPAPMAVLATAASTAPVSPIMRAVAPPTGPARLASVPPDVAVPRSPGSSPAPSLSAWLLWRPGGGGPASFGTGTLGGAQAGARLTVPILRERLPGVALSARVSSPLRRSGTEAALGIEWQPARNLPVRILAERRQRVSGEGRSAFALLAHGGVSERPLAGAWSLDGYGAAGVVGARRRDLFVEGSATVTRPLGPVRAGAGVWGGAQPGVERLDVGPTVALPLRVGPANARLSLDYRLRVAGSAAPGSGPALTLSTGF